MSVAVTILTNGKRRGDLDRCLASLRYGCRYRPLDIYILDNGSVDTTREYLDELEDGYGLRYHVKSLEEDVGCAAGTNMVSEMAREHDYVLHVESDFFHLPPEESGFDYLWLKDALDFVSSGRCDYLYLRRMMNEKEMMAHWWAQWMPKINTFDKYMHCPGFWWSNNPHLRNNKAIYDRGILPLDEKKDGPKGSEGWSKPELEAGRPGLTWIAKWGVFVHERDSLGDPGCSRVRGGKCKYGFSVDDGRFCKVCDLSKGIEDMPEHQGRYCEQVRV